MAGVGLDFSPQLIDENAQVLGFFSVIGSPDGLQEAAVRLSFAGIGNELAQKFELFGREADWLLLHHHGALFKINLQIVGDEGRSGVSRRGAAERGADARHELFDPEGFDDVVVGSGIESLHFVAFGIAHGEHDDGRIAGGANFAAGFEAGNSRQVHIEKNQIGPYAADFFERFFAAAHFDDGVAVRREGGEHDAADLRFVVYYEDRRGVHQSLARPRSVGSVNEKTEPWPRWLVRLMVPPCASMMALAMGKPMPVPCTR